MEGKDIKIEVELIKQNCEICTDKIVKSVEKLEKKIDSLFEDRNELRLKVQKLEGDKTGTLALVTAISGAILSIITGLTTGIILIVRYM